MRIYTFLFIVHAALVGCASPGAPTAFQFNSKQLGLGYYFPDAWLKLEPKSSHSYNATLSYGVSPIPRSAQDFMLVPYFELLIIYCPAWRLANKVDAKSAEVRFISERRAYEVSEIELNLSNSLVNRSAPSQGPRTEVLNFTSTEWQRVQKWCEKPEELNRAW